jgi:excisionase family DNA binding protein
MADKSSVSLQQAASHLGVSAGTVRRLIDAKILRATQVVAGAPWQIPRAALDSAQVREAVEAAKARPRASRSQKETDANLRIPGL